MAEEKKTIKALQLKLVNNNTILIPLFDQKDLGDKIQARIEISKKLFGMMDKLSTTGQNGLIDLVDYEII